MKGRTRAVFVLCASGLILYGSPVLAGATRQDETGECALTLSLGAIRITTEALETRCEIENRSTQDIWVYAQTPASIDLNYARGTNAQLFMAKDTPTLLILKRTDLPYYGAIYANPRYHRYIRLRAGQRLPETFLVHRPVVHEIREFDKVVPHGNEEICGLVFGIGYYTSEDLDRYVPDAKRDEGIEFAESGDVVHLRGYIGSPIWKQERVLELRVTGMHLPPYREWLHFDAIQEPSGLSASLASTLERQVVRYGQVPYHEYQYALRLFRCESVFNAQAQQIADIYVQFAVGRLDPNEVGKRLDAILSPTDRASLLDELERKEAASRAPKTPPLTLVAALRDMFYEFRLSLDEWRYAHNLLSIDRAWFNSTAGEIATVYMQVAEGVINPSELTSRLDSILSKAERERLLSELQAASTCKEGNR